jgi:hypothetical protein
VRAQDVPQALALRAVPLLERHADGDVARLGQPGLVKGQDLGDEDEELGVELSVRKVKERVIAKGFTEDQWLAALEEYTTLDVSFPYNVTSQVLFETNRNSIGLANRWRWHETGVCHG